MKKLSVIVLLSLMLPSLSAFCDVGPLFSFQDQNQEFDYVSFANMPTSGVELFEGDIAKCVSGFSNGGQPHPSFKLILANGSEEYFDYDEYIVGPGTVFISSGTANLAIDRAIKRQEKYSVITINKGGEYTLGDNDTLDTLNVSQWGVSVNFKDPDYDPSFFDNEWWGTKYVINRSSREIGPAKIFNNSDDRAHFILRKSSDTGSKVILEEWNETKQEWEFQYSDGTLASNFSNPVPDPNNVKYDQLLGWCYFTDTPWFYSYTNGSWYYMHSLPDGIYVWNANLPNDGWMKLHG